MLLLPQTQRRKLGGAGGVSLLNMDSVRGRLLFSLHSNNNNNNTHTGPKLLSHTPQRTSEGGWLQKCLRLICFFLSNIIMANWQLKHEKGLIKEPCV